MHHFSSCHSSTISRGINFTYRKRQQKMNSMHQTNQETPIIHQSFVLPGTQRFLSGSPLSRSSNASSSRLTGCCESGSSLIRLAACSCTSTSSSSSLYGSCRWCGGDAAEDEPPERARDRTTSPLQIGQVRRLVVSHGVLRKRCVSMISDGMSDQQWRNLHALCMELVAAWQTHDSTDTVDILLQTDNALSLFASIPSSPFC